MKLLIYALFILLSSTTFAQKDQRGLLPEVQATPENEAENEKKSLNSEILITRTETKAIDSLQAILKRKKGQPEEADLWNRLAELYMRRSKSGRFFDLFLNEKTKQLSSIPVTVTKGSDWIKKAISVYFKIEREFKKFPEMDSVLFNNAFAHQLLGDANGSEKIYLQLVRNYPNSSLVPDTLLALGELYYDNAKFRLALEQFENLSKYPDSRVYSYGMYKMAWTYYNLKNTSQGIQKLVEVLKLNPPLRPDENFTKGHYLRKEALRDLGLFVADELPASELYSFFKDKTAANELGQVMIDLAKFYETHNREKEINLFLNEFIKKESENAFVVSAYLIMVSGSETLKLRDLVIENLQKASELCKPGSSWRISQSEEIIENSCRKEFRQASLEIASKWWEIWLKNKQHVAFSQLTEKAFRIILDNDDHEKPDLKTRYALAELLFQLGKFDESSDHYKFVGDRTPDKTLAHDSTYAALFAKEKSLEAKKTDVKEAERKDLALNYVKKFPQGSYALDVSMKIAVIYYEEKNYEESLKWLTPLAEQKTNKEVQTKAEDLVLDIFNLKKDFVKIKNLAQSYLAKNPGEDRKKAMTKIMEEAHYAEIQESASKSEPLKTAQQLIQYSDEHPSSKLSASAQWQALSLLYSQGHSIEAADLTLSYIKKYPHDEKNLEALKEAAKSYAESGRILAAAELYEQLAEKDKKNRLNYLENAADFYSLEKKDKLSRKLYNQLLTQVDSKKRADIFNKILNTFSEKEKDPEYSKIQNILVSQDIEPYATQILTQRAQAQLKNKQIKEAFESARKIMSRDVPAESRVEARLIQAEILEKELFMQSVKSSQEDRLGLVLAMKTEKLEKAQTAYLSASKMSDNPKIQLLAFQGIDRCYQNYVESLKAVVPPPTLSPEDQKVLLGELSKIIVPIDEKRQENQKLISQLAKNALGKENTFSWTDLAIENTIAPSIKYPEAKLIQPFFPESFMTSKNSYDRVLPNKKAICDLRKWTSINNTDQTQDIAENCFAAQDWKTLEKMALELTRTKEKRVYGLYLLSFASEGLGQDLKAYWLIEQVDKDLKSNPTLLFQKARLAYKLEGLTSFLALFAKVLDTTIQSTEIETFKGIKAYSENNFDTALQIFSRLPKEQVYTMNVGLLLSEAYAQKGNLSQSLKIVNEQIQMKKNEFEAQLHRAHLLEFYKNSASEAVEAYEKAKLATNDVEAKIWIDKKIGYLKGLNKKVGLNVSTGD